MLKVLERWGCEEASAMDVYTDVFRLGEGLIQKNGEPSGLHKTNPIIIGNLGPRRVKNIMFEDEFEVILNRFQDYQWAFLSGLTYWGRDNLGGNQSKMYAMIFDLDGVTAKSLDSFLDGAHAGVYPLPNYIVMSGHGVHLYYIFDTPISLYPNIKVQLKELKYALTDIIWNERTSTDEHIQYQGINQAYRIVGGKTKIEGVRARAFRVNSHPIDLDYLNEFVDEDCQVNMEKLYKESTMTLEEAKERYPEWYERRIVRGAPRSYWKSNRALYDWWKTQIFNDAVFGKRYYCVMALAIFAIKCGIEEEELRQDAYAFSEMLNVIAPDEPFLSSDVESALECYDERYITFPRKDLEKLTGVEMPERKRNGQDRKTHLQSDYWVIDGKLTENKCKANRESRLKELRDAGEIKGRPVGSGTKQEAVVGYFSEHPNSSIREAASNLKIAPNTVRKWKPKDIDGI